LSRTGGSTREHERAKTNLAKRGRRWYLEFEIEEDLAVIRSQESVHEIKTEVGGGHSLTHKVFRPQLFKKLIAKERRGATFAAFQKNECSHKVLVQIGPTKSDALPRLTVAARANFLSSPANAD
jgi:hypothetical protein